MNKDGKVRVIVATDSEYMANMLVCHIEELEGAEVTNGIVFRDGNYNIPQKLIETIIKEGDLIINTCGDFTKVPCSSLHIKVKDMDMDKQYERFQEFAKKEQVDEMPTYEVFSALAIQDALRHSTQIQDAINEVKRRNK